ncbi:3-hydroxyisobutyrate dehydrogenase [Steroidobacter denitrificans]|uniref:3-hydroxyisobutyrate dehydrogenase n=1 Tax=Steroidobacter denitrificans TaxID=465721 RepID=A0A127F769_STEDE|nr:NAD(P)-binding domain-containing protein [Steroidobacter denitrificans]AMN46247.1 3-hydroxyisobutyrate dehydrogenase [Steroidobacter denitrificans]
MKVAYIGLGSMGAPQARLIARAGHQLAVHDAFPAARAAFRSLARIADSAADAAQDAEIACVCVRDDRQVNEVVLGDAGLVQTLASGSLILIHSTVEIATLHALQAKLAPRGIALVDAPVSRTRSTDEEAFVFTLLGGDTRDVERARTLVTAFSTDVEHLGPLGAGMAAKIANNLVTWTHLVVGSQAANLAAYHGVTYEKLRRVMTANGNLTPTVTAMLDGKQQSPPGTNPVRDQFLASQAGIGEKDLGLAIDCGKAAGLSVAMMSATRELVRGMMTGALVQPAR